MSIDHTSRHAHENNRNETARAEKYKAQALRDATRLIEAHEENKRLREAAELAVTACLPLLPLRGSWGAGYEVQQPIDPELRATPQEWADAAHHVAELHRVLEPRP